MQLDVTYAELTAILDSKGGLCQYRELDNKYVVWVPDSGITYATEVWKAGFEPQGVSPDDNAITLGDFETNIKPTCNKSLRQYEQPLIQTSKRSYGSRAWTFSHNFCDKTTWFGDSIRVVAEAVGTGDGSTVVFNLANPYVIDTSHGKMTDEDNVVPTATQTGTTFIPEIKIAGVTKTERAYGAGSGGDYTIDYVTGIITFFVAPANAAAVTASYFYSPANAGSTLYLRPNPGKKTIITAIECMFSDDVDMTNTFITAFFTYNPGLGAPPAKFEYPGTRAPYKRMWDFIGYTNGSYPPMPPLGGTRGYAHAIYQLRFEYVVTIEVDDAFGAELRCWIENHIPYGGECALIAFYGYQD